MSRSFDPSLLPLDTPTPDTSFTSLLGRHGLTPMWATAAGELPEIPEGTTVLALRYADGVVMAGDRRATAGNIIAHKRVQKVFAADDFSAVAISGTAGMAVELIKLFQTELEHYEKIEGALLSLDGKANRLATMIRGNLGMAMQGLAVVPVFAGYDIDRGVGRIFSYDVTGGRYEERDHHSVGSGSVFARTTLKKRWQPDLGADQAVSIGIEALLDAADDDSATGGADERRRIYPVVATVTGAGYHRLDDEQVEPVVSGLLEQVRERYANADGGAQR